jgi:hypothetical protein
MKYTPRGNGEWMRSYRGWHRIACCDCGLVHDFKFSRAVRFRAFRDKRATAAKRAWLRKRQQGVFAK